MSIANCKRCGRVFQKTISPLCQNCLNYEDSQSREIYRYVQANPGVNEKKLAEQFEIPVQDVENLLFSGLLGTAGGLVLSQCARCKCDMSLIRQTKYYCEPCNRIIKEEIAGKNLIEPGERKRRLLEGSERTIKEEGAEGQTSSSRRDRTKQYGFRSFQDRAQDVSDSTPFSVRMFGFHSTKPSPGKEGK